MTNNYFLFLLFFGIISIQACKDGGGETETPKPVLSISDAQFQEGNSNNTVQVVVTVTGENPGNAIVSYATIDGTAVGGSDFNGTSDGELVIPANATQATINITLRGDEFTEEDEEFEILLLNPTNATLGNERATITILNDDIPSGEIIPTEGYVTPTSYPGRNLVWADEFQADQLDNTSWTHEIGNGSSGWGNNELQYYKAENTSIYDNEYLVIEAREEPFAGFNYTSSRLVTMDKREFQYGRVDIRAALPEGQGLWPALWMLGEDFTTTGWPACGEIDIMELVGHTPNRVHGTVHYGSSVAQHQFNGGSKFTSDGSKYSEKFHVFSIIWEEDLIQFYVDDVLYYDVDPTEMNAGQSYPFNNGPFFFIFNVAVGGDWPGSPDASTIFPQRMIVDYIRVFQ